MLINKNSNLNILTVIRCTNPQLSCCKDANVFWIEHHAVAKKDVAGAINKWQNAPLGLHFANISEKLTRLSCKMVLEPCVCVGRKSVQFLFHGVAYVE